MWDLKSKSFIRKLNNTAVPSITVPRAICLSPLEKTYSYASFGAFTRSSLHEVTEFLEFFVMTPINREFTNSYFYVLFSYDSVRACAQDFSCSGLNSNKMYKHEFSFAKINILIYTKLLATFVSNWLVLQRSLKSLILWFYYISV